MVPPPSGDLSSIDHDFVGFILPTYSRMARFLIKTFEAEAVVFDAASGDTHYLSPLAYSLLNTSQAQPGIAYQDLPEALALTLNLEPDSAFRQLTDEAISSLQRIGLLARA